MPRRVQPEDRDREGAREVGTRDTGRRASLADLRQRVRAGRYETTEVMDQVARRILKSGDLACDASSPTQRTIC